MLTERTPANSTNYVRLTPTERRVLERVVLGETNKEVAICLGCSPKTVEFHLGHIFQKTGVNRRTRLISVVAIRFARAGPVTVAGARFRFAGSPTAGSHGNRVGTGPTFVTEPSKELPARAAGLTNAEIRVLKHVLLGATTREIAAQLTCSARTVEFHIGHILRKTGLDSRTRLISAAASARVRIYPPNANRGGRVAHVGQCPAKRGDASPA
jgi:DNA-binding CsgD family transcriptional regulator